MYKFLNLPIFLMIFLVALFFIFRENIIIDAIFGLAFINVAVILFLCIYLYVKNKDNGLTLLIHSIDCLIWAVAMFFMKFDIIAQNKLFVLTLFIYIIILVISNSMAKNETANVVRNIVDTSTSYILMSLVLLSLTTIFI